MPIDQQTFSRFLHDLSHDMQMMFKSEYQYTEISSNHFLSEIDVLMYNRIESTLQVVYNTYTSNATDRWTEIYEHLVGIRDTCRLRLIESYWLKFEACLKYARENSC